MKQTLLHIALLVRDYDEAIVFFTEILHFSVVEDTHLPDENKRWVLVAPPGSGGSNILLARPSNPEQEAYVGNQTGGRVTFFLGTNDFWRDYDDMVSRGVEFIRQPSRHPYGTVAVFKDGRKNCELDDSSMRRLHRL